MGWTRKGRVWVMEMNRGCFWVSKIGLIVLGLVIILAVTCMMFYEVTWLRIFMMLGGMLVLGVGLWVERQ